MILVDICQTRTYEPYSLGGYRQQAGLKTGLHRAVTHSLGTVSSIVNHPTGGTIGGVLQFGTETISDRPVETLSGAEVYTRARDVVCAIDPTAVYRTESPAHDLYLDTHHLTVEAARTYARLGIAITAAVLDILGVDAPAVADVTALITPHRATREQAMTPVPQRWADNVDAAPSHDVRYKMQASEVGIARVQRTNQQTYCKFAHQWAPLMTHLGIQEHRPSSIPPVNRHRHHCRSTGADSDLGVLSLPGYTMV